MPGKRRQPAAPRPSGRSSRPPCVPAERGRRCFGMPARVVREPVRRRRMRQRRACGCAGLSAVSSAASVGVFRSGRHLFVCRRKTRQPSAYVAHPKASREAATPHVSDEARTHLTPIHFRGCRRFGGIQRAIAVRRQQAPEIARCPGRSVPGRHAEQAIASERVRRQPERRFGGQGTGAAGADRHRARSGSGRPIRQPAARADQGWRRHP